MRVAGRAPRLRPERRDAERRTVRQVQGAHQSGRAALLHAEGRPARPHTDPELLQAPLLSRAVQPATAHRAERPLQPAEIERRAANRSGPNQPVELEMVLFRISLW